MLYDSYLLFLILGGIPRAALRSKSSISHSRGYFSGLLYDSILLFLIPRGIPWHALRSKSSISHSRGYFSGWLYEPNLHFLIPGGISRACSTIHIFFSSFSGVFPWAALRSKSSISHSKGYFPGMLYDSYLHFLIPRDTFPANFFGSLSHSNQ